MAISRTYRGFSTLGAERSRTWSQADVELIKRDLLNHFHTRKGERVMRPEYGCYIWDLLEEQMTKDVRQEIIDEAERVCASDPRVRQEGIFLFDYDNGIRIEITLEFIGLGIMDTFAVEFERRESAAFNGSTEF